MAASLWWCIVLAGILRTAWSMCVETDAYSVSLEPTGRFSYPDETRITFHCSINIPDLYPKWKIDDQVYDITHLPFGFEATQFNFSFVFEWEAEVSCFYTVFLDGEIVDVCSPVTTVIPEYIKDDENYPHCDITIKGFYINKENYTVYISSDDDTDTEDYSCDYNGVISTFSTTADQTSFSGTLNVSNDVCSTVGLEDYLENYFGRPNIEVDITLVTCDCNIIPVCFLVLRPTENVSIPRNHNESISISYDTLPDVYDATFSTNCKVCIYDGEKCKCGDYYDEIDNQSISVKVNSVKNGTIISILCITYHCITNLMTYAMLSNVEILVCEECSVNADCLEGSCVCKVGYTGNGTICDALPGPPKALSVEIDCNAPLERGRPVLIHWTVDEQDDTMKVCGFVELIGSKGNCSSETETQCTLNITSDANYGVSVILSNAYGSSAAKTFYFNSTELHIEDNLDQDPPSVNVTLNKACSSPLNVTVSFGVRGEDNNCSCELSQTKNLSQGMSVVFEVDIMKLELSHNQEYCYSLFPCLPNPPKALSVEIDCNAPLESGRPILIHWTVDEQDNTMKVCGFVELIGTEENCSSETETQCTLNITSDASYGVSVMLSNAYGSSAAKTFYFNSTKLHIQDNLDQDPPSVNVTLNEACSSPLNVTVSFGVKGEDNNCSCCEQFQTKNLSQGMSAVFEVDMAKLKDQEYCYSLVPCPAECTSESPPPPPATIAAIVIGVIIFVLYVAIQAIKCITVIFSYKELKDGTQRLQGLRDAPQKLQGKVIKLLKCKTM